MPVLQMESVKDQLQVLNQEAASLTAEVMQAWQEFREASTPDKAAYLAKHNQLVSENAALDQRRSKLEERLAGGCWHLVCVLS